MRDGAAPDGPGGQTAWRAEVKAVILAGGFGTRISEESHLRPKPMIEIGGRPIIWHIMKIYSQYGIDDFIICCGYKGYTIKEYFFNYSFHNSDLTVDLNKGGIEIHKKSTESWRVTLVDTGEQTMTGGRLKRVADYVDDTFCLTYGDGVADIDVGALVDHHRASGLDATVTAVQPAGRFGGMTIDSGRVAEFREKPPGDGRWINGGFFVCEPSVLDRIEGDATSWELEPLEGLARDGRLGVFQHDGFWAAMDTLRDKTRLEALWSAGDAPWKLWS